MFYAVLVPESADFRHQARLRTSYLPDYQSDIKRKLQTHPVIFQKGWIPANFPPCSFS
jgi:hypothetical protein